MQASWFTTRTGVGKIHDNSYENCLSLGIDFDTKAVADGFYRKPGQTVATPPLVLENETLVNVKKVTGTYFDFVKPGAEEEEEDGLLRVRRRLPPV